MTQCAKSIYKDDKCTHMIGKSFDMSAHLPPALAKVQKCTNVQGVVVQKYKSTKVQKWWYKSRKVHKCTGSGGTKVQKCTNVQQGVVVQMQKFTKSVQLYRW